MGNTAAPISTGGIRMDDADASVPVTDAIAQMPESLREQAQNVTYRDASQDKNQTQVAAGYKTEAYVDPNDPNTVNVQHPDEVSPGTLAHETMHSLQFNEPPTELYKQTYDSNPKTMYDISDVGQLRQQGKTLTDLPIEKQAAIVGEYVKSNGDRKDLKPWIDDIRKLKQSTIQPTTKNQSGINTTARPPQGGQQMLKDLEESDVHNPPPKKASWGASAVGLKGK